MKYPIIYLILITLLFISCSSSPEVQDKQENILYLLELTESAKLAMQVFDNLIPQLKILAPTVPEEYWESIEEEIDPDELISLIVPIYDKFYTNDDILQLIKFYKSPIGQKVISQQSEIMTESMKAGEVWGKQIAEKIIMKLQKDGYLNI